MTNEDDLICIFTPTKNSKIYGYVMFSKSNNNLTKVYFNLSGFEPCKSHAIHIHEFSDLSNGCMSLGGHYNPYNKEHGNINIHGTDRHAGDLINNLHSDKCGKFVYSYYDNLIDIKDIVNRSIVIHEGTDDLGLYRDDNSVSKEKRLGSKTTGNAGGRMTCSIIKKLNK